MKNTQDFLMIKPLLFVVIEGKTIVTHPYEVDKVRIHDLRNMSCMICKSFSNFKREIHFLIVFLLSGCQYLD